MCKRSCGGPGTSARQASTGTVTTRAVALFLPCINREAGRHGPAQNDRRTRALARSLTWEVAVNNHSPNVHREPNISGLLSRACPLNILSGRVS